MRLSVVIPTYCRPALVRRLVAQLAEQTLPVEDYEVIVVDDGSTPALRLEDLGPAGSLRLRLVVQPNGGAAAARHTGALAASAPVLVFVDDDMQIGPEFLALHAEQHAAGTRRVVLGRLRPDPSLEEMPFFERWHAQLMDRTAARLQDGAEQPQGALLYTGNVSLPREAYLEVGGFDPRLRLSEDIDLGFRLERAGLEFVFQPEAGTRHGSDRSTVQAWRARALRYGGCDLAISRKHPELRRASPFRLLFEVHPATRLLGALALFFPLAGRAEAWLLLRAISRLEELGSERAVLAATSVTYTVDYFRGLGESLGSPAAAWRELRDFASRHEPSVLAFAARARP